MRFPVLLIALLVFCGPARLAGQTMPGQRDAQPGRQMAEFQARMNREVQTQIGRWTIAWSEADRVRLSDHYAEDALLLTPDPRPLRGPGAISDQLVRLAGAIGPIQLTVDDFMASGEMAYVFGSYEPVSAPAEDSWLGAGGRYTMVLRRNGRSWRIRSQLFIPAAPSSVATDPRQVRAARPEGLPR